LFSRPELKVERVTYPVMTPTAARGVLEAIFWKPQMHYRVVAIEVLKPIRQFTIRRNETHQVVPLSAAVRGDRVDTAAHRDQRNAVCLREVAYRIHAHIESAGNAGKNAAAYRDQLRRRVTRGACFHQPFLGTGEFSADFGDPDDTERIHHTEDLGVMLHTIHFGPPIRMEWFTARLDDGVLHIPARGIEMPASADGES
jgi:CRISPR-associated protein Cas5d